MKTLYSIGLILLAVIAAYAIAYVAEFFIEEWYSFPTILCLLAIFIYSGIGAGWILIYKNDEEE